MKWAENTIERIISFLNFCPKQKNHDCQQVGGVKMSKNPSTWFMDDPQRNKKYLNGTFVHGQSKTNNPI